MDIAGKNMSNIKSKLMLSDLVDQLSVAICIVRRDYTIAMVNEYFVTRSKVTTNELVGQNLLEKYPESQHFLKRKIDTAFMIESPTFSSWEQAPHVLPFYTSRPISGSEDRMFQNIEVLPIHSDDGSLEHVCLCIHDVTLQAAQHHSLKELTVKLNNEQHQLEDALNKLKQAQSQLLQSEKMASIGQLSAGIAHEINNPIGFITSNLQTLDDYFSTVKNHIQQLNTLINSCEIEKIIDIKEKAEKKINLDYILDDLSDLIQESLEGSSRVMAIVKNLKEFSHIDSSEWNYSNLENGLESTLKIINNEVKYNIEVEKHFSKDVPEVYCQPMQINQVFLNILVNACHAIEGKGKISIFLDKHDDDFVSIKIADTGSGIPQEILSSIFDPFFTTKPVGSGTGLGLSVSYGIVAKHKGKIEVESEVGKGSTFTILLPINQNPQQDASK
ncbi:ATP-binding protein [Vibrio cidicii]|uniref:PAS domain-containing sensor histidine kinase n=1 Tax=Vibrio cidicii TaxID=1763883 RepID=UPI0037539FE3